MLPIQTNEFSVVLACDDALSGLISDIRASLPETPYYDSLPHITLLRGIRSDTALSDAELTAILGRLLNTDQLRELYVTPKKIANGFNHIYKTSSAITIKTPPALKTSRRKFIKDLESNGFSVEMIEKLVYLPHVTIRLGVPLRGQLKTTAMQRLAQFSKVNFNHIYIFRICKQDGKRTVRTIKLT